MQILNHDVHNQATTSFDFTKGDYDSLCYFLSNSDFSPCLESDNIEHVWCYISELIKDGIKQFIPTIRVNRYNQPKWFNSSIRHNINRVRTLRRKYNLIQNSQAVKKQCGPQKGYGEKRCEIQGGGQEMAVMVG